MTSKPVIFALQSLLCFSGFYYFSCFQLSPLPLILVEVLPFRSDLFSIFPPRICNLSDCFISHPSLKMKICAVFPVHVPLPTDVQSSTIFLDFFFFA